MPIRLTQQADKLEFAELAIEMHDIESHVIASQSSDWRGNPHPHAMSDNNVVKENGLPHQRARWFAMTTLFDKFQFIVLPIIMKLMKGPCKNHVLFSSVLGQPGILPDGDLCAGGGAARRFSHALCV